MSLRDLNEQRAAADLLQRSLERGRLAHAYLFAGPRGAGKESVARTLAQALNCLEQDAAACGQCDACRRIAEGVHPDVYWVRPELKSRRISVDRIRDLERSLYLKSAMARIKVGIIVDADCLTEQASNAFLKTLEEPPSQTVLLLLSAEPQRLLPTILSRCLRLPFGPAAARMASPYRAQLLPLLADFNPRGAHKIMATYQLHGALTSLLQQIRERIRQQAEADAGADRYEELEPDARERLEQQSEARIEGEYRAARELVLEELYSWFSDLLLCVEGADPRLFEHGDEVAALRRSASDLTYEQAQSNLEAVEQIRESLARNIAEPLALEVGLLKLQ